MQLIEVNFDGLVGPTHHFGGLGIGNRASQQHGGQLAHPRAAALQGLQKMRLLHSLGAFQAVLPPQRRPDLRLLGRLGFRGSPERRLRAAADQAPPLLSAAWSASAMWTANAATVSAASDSQDGRTHLSVANLCSSLHRSLEPPQTLRLLRRIFGDGDFAVHPPLPPVMPLRDEGAANHMRLFDPSGGRGLNLFIYGADERIGGGADQGVGGAAAGDASGNRTQGRRFPARQTLAASQAIARRHRLSGETTFFLAQHPDAIDAGAFHNDVVATSCQHILLHHQKAFLSDRAALTQIERAYANSCGQPLRRIEISDAELPLADAIRSYLFNSQLVIDPADPQSIDMVCPMQVAEQPAAAAVARRLASGPIRRVHFVELRESMSNGGGPACLRLRVPMTAAQYDRLPSGIRWSEALADRLAEAIEGTYPETLTVDDLADPLGIDRACAAVDALQAAMGWPPA